MDLDFNGIESEGEKLMKQVNLKIDNYLYLWLIDYLILAQGTSYVHQS